MKGPGTRVYIWTTYMYFAIFLEGAKLEINIAVVCIARYLQNIISHRKASLWHAMT